MATKTTNKTIWTLALVAVLGFLVWKLWPVLKNKLAGSSSGGSSGGVGSSSPYPYYEPDEDQDHGLGANLGIGGGGPPGQSGGAGPLTTQDEGGINGWLNNFLAQGWDNSNYINSDLSYDATTGADQLLGLDQSGLPLEPTQNFDVNQLATDLPTSDYDASAYTSVISGDDVGGYISGGDGGDDGGDYGGGGGDGGENDSY